MIQLETIEENSVELNEKFFAVQLSEEHKAQIITLTKDASAFVWEYQRLYFPYEGLEESFSQKQTWNWVVTTRSQQKKWLYQRGIPFSHKVLVSINPESAFVMTWKMIVKYYDSLFQFNRQLIWDKTLNWCLYYYESRGSVEWSFYKNRMYKDNNESR